MDFLKGLNAQQREAVSHTEGPLLILAGAGSGKTRVITHRIAHIITAQHVPPSAILAVTFTNKAAGEMRERVAALLRRRAAGVVAQRFHLSLFLRAPAAARWRSAGAHPPRLHAALQHLRRRRSARHHQSRLIARWGWTRRSSCSIARCSRRSATPRTPSRRRRISTSSAVNPEGEAVAAVFEEYEKALRTANALDFDDLLLEAVRLLQHDEATREAWNRRLSYVMVDEYQDTNRSQYELMRLLSESHNNVCVVGDEDQSIYSWRGADIRNILDFERDFPKAKTIRLEQNYRSTKNILAAAGAVVENNKERKGKKLWTESDGRRHARPLRRLRRRERSAVHRRHHRKAPGVPIPATMWRCSTAPTPSRGRLKKRCGATGASTTWSAASVSTSARKSRTRWRT